VILSHSDINNWSQPTTGAKPNTSAGSSPEWEYLNVQDLLNPGHSVNQRLINQESNSPWPNKVGESSVPQRADQMMHQAFLKPQEMSWPCPPGLQQTKFVRPGLPQQVPQLPIPNFPQSQHPQMPVTQGVLPQAQPPFPNLSLPQHSLGVNLPLPQHQFSQPQGIPNPVAHEGVTPDSPVMPSAPVIRPGNENPLTQGGLFLSHPGMNQAWPPGLHPGQVQVQVQQSQGQFPITISAKQPFLPVRPVMSSQTREMPFQLQQLQQQLPQPFSSPKQIRPEQPWHSKDQAVSTPPALNPQVRPPPGLHPPQPPKQESGGANQMRQEPRKNDSQAHPHMTSHTPAEIHGLHENLALRNAQQQQNSPKVHQSNKAVKNQNQRDPRSPRAVPMIGADPAANGDGRMDYLKAALNYIDFNRVSIFFTLTSNLSSHIPLMFAFLFARKVARTVFLARLGFEWRKSSLT